MQARLRDARVPRRPLGPAAGMPGAHQQDVAWAHAHPLLALGRLVLLGNTSSPGSSHRIPRRRGTSSSTPRPTRPSFRTSIAPDPAPPAVTDSSGVPS